MTEYVLGTSDHELARLEFQHEVWGEVTADFLDRLAIRPGSRVADLGCGPGHVLELLRERTGPTGLVTGVDESERWIAHVEATIRRRSWSNVKAIRSRLQELELEPESQDVLFLRWVLSFLPRPSELLSALGRWLRPGGAIAVLDYNHEGVSLFPDSEGFRAAIRATRKLYALKGGDTFVMGHINRHFFRAGFEPFLLRPYVIAGGPESPAFRWADAFFPYHSQSMVEAGLMTGPERERFLAEWAERKRDPASLFFSPIVVGAAARKPSRGNP